MVKVMRLKREASLASENEGHRGHGAPQSYRESWRSWSRPFGGVLGKLDHTHFLVVTKVMEAIQGIDSASLCSLAGQYDNPIPTQFLAPQRFF
jgi:hypothetical protein